MTVTEGLAEAPGRPGSSDGPATDPDVGGRRPGGGLDLDRSLGLLLAAVGFLIGSRVVTDNSFLTHLGTGNLILELGAVPTADPYSALAAGQPWTVQSWLVSLLYAGLDSALGGWSIRMLNGSLTAAITLGLWRLVAPARQVLTRVGLVSLALLIGTYLWPPRPLLVGLLAMVVVLQVAQGHRPRWWLVPVFWIWVSSHGSFVLGCGLLVALLVGASIDERRLAVSELRTALVAAVGCALAIVNPLGWRLLWFPLHMMDRREALDRVSEWSSPSFRSPVEQLFLLLLVLIVVAAVRGASWRVLVPALVFFVAGLMAVRNLGLASVVILALVSPSLEGLPSTIDGGLVGRLPRLVTAGAAMALSITVVSVMTTAPVDVEDYPIAEIEWLEARSLIARPDVLVAQRDYVGNYLTLRYGAEARVFMDDRFDFHPLEIIRDHNGLLLGGDYDDIVGRNDFDVVLWATDTPMRRWIDDHPSAWDVVLDGESWFVACRITSPVYHRCQS